MKHVHSGSFVFLTLLLGLGFAVSLSAQTRPVWLDQAAKVIYPEGYDPENQYPLLVWLPYTGGTAEEVFSYHEKVFPREKFIVLLPAGRPLATDYLPAFARFVEWYEEALLREIGKLLESLRHPPAAVVLAGHSLGGDVGWALTLRNPRNFTGAVLSGTRAGYPPSAPALEALLTTKTRYHLFLGELESRTRSLGLRRAEEILRNGGLETEFTVISNQAHELPPYPDFVAAIAWAARIE